MLCLEAVLHQNKVEVSYEVFEVPSSELDVANVLKPAFPGWNPGCSIPHLWSLGTVLSESSLSSSVSRDDSTFPSKMAEDYTGRCWCSRCHT